MKKRKAEEKGKREKEEGKSADTPERRDLKLNLQRREARVLTSTFYLDLLPALILPLDHPLRVEGVGHGRLGQPRRLFRRQLNLDRLEIVFEL